MKITKKVECLNCKTIVEENGTCKCGNVVLSEGQLVKGTIGVDAIDHTPKLLNE